jgi:ABC-type glycerol-3-phosphate transport system substrate-binding protein
MSEKKIFIVAIIAYLALVFVCWDDAIDKNKEGRVMLAFWHTYSDLEEQILKEVIKEWESKNAGFTVRPVRIPFDGHKPKLRTALTVGQGPDMARVDWSFVCELARKNAVVDLERFEFSKIRDNYLRAPLETGFIDGKYYGIPDQTTCVAMFYNKKMFKEAGLEPGVPATWEEFIEVGKQLSNSSEGKYAFAMTNTLWWSLPFFNTFGARIISKDGKKCELGSDEAIAALKMMSSFVNEHKIEAGAWRPGAISPEQGFVNNKYAMIFMGPWNLAKFENANIDFGVGLIPAGPAGTSTNVGGTDTVIFKHSPYVKECYDFLTFFTNAKNQARWCSELNQLPINLGAYDLVKFDNEYLNVFMEQMKHARVNPVVSSYGLLEDLVNPEMEAVLSQQRTAKDALTSVAAKIEERILNQ